VLRKKGKRNVLKLLRVVMTLREKIDAELEDMLEKQWKKVVDDYSEETGGNRE
jgi:hypothetical protein